jgi:hypothetical protein
MVVSQAPVELKLMTEEAAMAVSRAEKVKARGGWLGYDLR